MIIVLCFYLLGTTADGFLAPALECIAIELRCSEQLAISFCTLFPFCSISNLFSFLPFLIFYGVTFLAFANGAPDVIGAIAATGSSAGNGVGLAVGAITGAGVYVAGVVSGVVNIFSNTRITVIPRVFLRDLSFYTIGLIILVASSFTKGISIPFCAAFLIWYCFFIIIVAIEDLCERIRNNR